MEPFAYLAGFATLILSLAVAHLLKGLSDLFEARERVAWDGTHLAVALWLVPLALVEWWVLFRWRFRWRAFADWTLPYFAFLALKPALVYVAATLAVPRVDDGPVDLWAHLQRVRPLLFGVLAAYAALDGVDTALKGWDYFAAQLPAAVLAPAFLMAVAGTAALTTGRRPLQVVVAVLWLTAVVLPVASASLAAL